MKKLLFVAILLVAVKSISGQVNYKIVYERTVNIHANLPENKKMLKSILPEKSVQMMVSHCNQKKASLKESSSESNKGNAAVSIKGMDGLYFFLFGQNVVRQYVNFDTYDYYVEKSLINILEKTKMSTKKILGYKCKKIIQNENKENEMIIWFTTEIPAYATPLPPIMVKGVILGIESEKFQYIAKSITKDNTAIVVEKQDAMKITEEQLKDLRNEKLEKQEGKKVKIKM
ncbi:MAG: GLPGLI family protein [Bacteroidales bacterium]|nr:GLPGLI family protein [Bacteroidales bacterium]